jgi:hypothetical protein
MIPFALPYIATARQLGFERPVPDSLRVERYLEVLPGNLLYGHVLPPALPNQNAAHFLGFLALGFGLLGARGRDRTPFRGLLLVFFVAGLALSLGPRIEVAGHDLCPGPYMLLRNYVPGFRNVRYPERLSLVAVIGLAPLVAMGLARMRGRLGSTGIAFFSALIFLEHLSLPQPLSFLPSGSEIPSVYRWLAAEPRVKVVAHVPTSSRLLERADAVPMYLSTVHWKRFPEGFTSYWPPAYNVVKWRLFDFPSEKSVSFLRRFGVDTVIVTPTGGALPSWVAGDERWEVRGPFPEGHAALRLKGPIGVGFSTPPRDDSLVEVSREGWRVDASAPGAELAIDNDPDTAWVSGASQRHGDFFLIRFPKPVVVARVSMNVNSFETQAEEFPTHFKILGRSEGAWSEIPYDADLSYDRFFAQLLSDPRSATLDADVPHTMVTAIRIRVTADEPYLMPFVLSEVRVYTRP